MLNIKYIQENTEVVKHSVKARELDVDVDLLLKRYEEWKKAKKDLDDLRREKNLFTEKINEARKQKKDFKKFVEQSKENNIKLKETETKFNKLDEEYNALIYKIPNTLHKDVPISLVELMPLICFDVASKASFRLNLLSKAGSGTITKEAPAILENKI